MHLQCRPGIDKAEVVLSDAKRVKQHLGHVRSLAGFRYAPSPLRAPVNSFRPFAITWSGVQVTKRLLATVACQAAHQYRVRHFCYGLRLDLAHSFT